PGVLGNADLGGERVADVRAHQRDRDRRRTPRRRGVSRLDRSRDRRFRRLGSAAGHPAARTRRACGGHLAALCPADLARIFHQATLVLLADAHRLAATAFTFKAYSPTLHESPAQRWWAAKPFTI